MILVIIVFLTVIKARLLVIISVAYAILSVKDALLPLKCHDTKEVRLRPKIEKHDRMVKLKKAQEFLEKGNKVQFMMIFRGREMAHQDLGVNVLNRVKGDTEEIAKVEAFPRLEGRQMVMVIAPK